MEPDLEGPRIPFTESSGDMVVFAGGEESFHYHILSFSWHGGRPTLRLREMSREGDWLTGEGGPFYLKLGAGEMSWRISGGSYCTGRMADDIYVACPDSRLAVEGYSQCWDCLTRDIPDPACIFEPHCHEGPCGARFCQVPHVVYATAFRRTVKIGMTQLGRMKERAMEQGADGMLPLLKLNDRFSARYFEGRISGTLGLPQVVRSPVKFKNLTLKRDLDKVEETLNDVKENVQQCWDEISSEIHPGAIVLEGPKEFDEGSILIDDYPLDEPLTSRPGRFKGERVRGVVLGYKGSYMFYRQGSIWAYRLSEAPGMVLSTDVKIGR